MALAPPDPVDADFSVVIPFYNEVGNVERVLSEVRTVLPHAEIVAVDDGSTDGTWERLKAFNSVRHLRLQKNSGQSAAIYHGLQACTRGVCGLMDGDGQNDPANFNILLKAYYQGSADVICGYRANRIDTFNRRAASRIANSIRAMILRDGIQDTGCSQKVFPREAVRALIPFRTMHRYLPVLFRTAGLRLAEVPIAHRGRFTGESKYDNFGRAIVGCYDLIGVSWLIKRRLPISHVEEA